MVNPALALGLFAFGALIVAVVVWPRRGLAARLMRLLRLTERARVEDALKRIYDAEYARQPCTIESIAGWLHLTRSRTMQLLSHLQALGLARTEADHLLTGAATLPAASHPPDAVHVGHRPHVDRVVARRAVQ